MLCKERYGQPDCVECDNLDPEAACPSGSAFYDHLAACPRCKAAPHWTRFCPDGGDDLGGDLGRIGALLKVFLLAAIAGEAGREVRRE